MTQELHILWDLLSALGVGLLIGIERGWSGRFEQEGDRVAGIRTFSLLGLLGGVWAELTDFFPPWVLSVAFFALAILVTASYIVTIREEEDIGMTTQISMLLTFSLGAWAAMGYYIYALGTTVVVMAFLNLKPELHSWLRKIEDNEIYAGIKLLVISVVLLPLLPNQGYGPWEALNPYWIWWMVVLISGLSFSGYFLMKYFGEQLGTMLTAITGGLASSTAVTISLAQFARRQRESLTTLFVAGVLLASSMKFVRVAVEVGVVNAALLEVLWLPLLLLFLSSVAGGYWLWRGYRKKGEEAPSLEVDNPLKLSTAVKFGLLLGLIMLAAAGMEEWLGDQGVYLLALVSGLVNVDAITLSLSRMAGEGMAADVAVAGILIAVITNTIVKGALFAFWVGLKRSLTLILLLLVISAIGLGGLLLI